MGQALDRDGNMLGEAFGETKREVFDKLIEQHGAVADEIRIRTMHAGTERPPEQMEQFFRYDHLPERLQTVSKPFAELAAAPFVR